MTDRPDSQSAAILPGDMLFDEYLSLLEGKRVALLSNHTGIAEAVREASPDDEDAGSEPFPADTDPWENSDGGGQHILDALIGHGVRVTAIFCPEHGFRGTADAGAAVGDSVDEKTGIPILSLYHENTHRPSAESMDSFDVLVVDMQDVGLRFYTYYISMYYLMEACALSGREMLLLDRPNPNGFYIDGPILREEYRSPVGQLPIPIVHGMTWGELAGMINGEGWLAPGRDALGLTVIPCRNYTHDKKTGLSRRPSPNLKNMRAVWLYASTCLFENTCVSVGRGTAFPFEVYGSPYLAGEEYPFSFVPESMDGAAEPPFEGETCHGRDLRSIPLQIIWEEGINLQYLIGAYRSVCREHPDVDFFDPAGKGAPVWIDLLSGSDRLRKMITAGSSAEEIRATWAEDIGTFREQRRPYLLYK